MTGGPASPLVPAYFHPATHPAAWRRLIAAGPGAGLVVVNVEDGPGPSADVQYLPLIAELLAAGVPLLGYVDTGYGRRDAAALRRAAGRWRDWYGVRGVFADQCPADEAGLAAAEALAGALRADGAGLLVLNPGTEPAPGLLDVADVVVTFEGPWARYEALAPPPAAGSARRAHLVHAVPAPRLPDVPKLAGDRGAAFCHASPWEGANPWGDLPG